MQIVIDIPEDLYKATINGLDADEIWDLRLAIKNGIPLQRHGRLGDLSKIYIELNEAQIEGTEEYKGLGKAKQIICNAPTIIEADKDQRELSVEESIKQRIARDVKQDVKAHTASGFIQGIRSPFE